MQSLLILGRQPALGIAELESLFGADKITLIGTSAALLDVEPKDVPFRRLGGSVKLARLLTELPYIDFGKITDYVNKTLPNHLGYIPDGKIKFGISTYGIRTDANSINRATLQVKKIVKAAGRSMRAIPNNDLALNSAQVLHNQLTSPLGMELLFVRNGESTLLAQTVAEQDIEAYAARDQGRPKRDTKVGMLPPKLAQTIVNLSVGPTEPIHGAVVLDPFCGTGVVLQEASLMGFDIYGSDLDERMINYTDENLLWLLKQRFSPVQRPASAIDDPNWRYYHLEKADATHHTWSPTPGFIACETYLGRPFSALPDQRILQEVMQDVNLIHKRFLQNVVKQTKAGFRMCIAVPAWKTADGFKHLKLLDNLEDMGYNRIEFVHARQEDLIYHREGQVVARELVILVRN